VLFQQNIASLNLRWYKFLIHLYKLAKKAVGKIKDENVPIFLEFSTYRDREHCGPNLDDDLGYRPNKELKQWRKKCSLENFQTYLVKKKITTQDKIEEMRKNIQTEIDRAFSSAKTAPFPEKKTLTQHIYSS